MMQHIFGILAEVSVWWRDRYYERPHPQPLFQRVQQMVSEDRWSKEAKRLCEAVDGEIEV